MGINDQRLEVETSQRFNIEVGELLHTMNIEKHFSVGATST